MLSVSQCFCSSEGGEGEREGEKRERRRVRERAVTGSIQEKSGEMMKIFFFFMRGDASNSSCQIKIFIINLLLNDRNQILKSSDFLRSNDR